MLVCKIARIRQNRLKYTDKTFIEFLTAAMRGDEP